MKGTDVNPGIAVFYRVVIEEVLLYNEQQIETAVLSIHTHRQFWLSCNVCHKNLQIIELPLEQLWLILLCS